MTKILSGNRVAIVAGTNGAAILLPPGSRLRFASARNITKPGQRVQLLLTDASKTPGNNNPATDLSREALVIAETTQDGVNNPACWSGDSGSLDPSLQLVVALYWNVDIGDSLLLKVGVDQ